MLQRCQACADDVAVECHKVTNPVLQRGEPRKGSHPQTTLGVLGAMSDVCAMLAGVWAWKRSRVLLLPGRAQPYWLHGVDVEPLSLQHTVTYKVHRMQVTPGTPSHIK